MKAIIVALAAICVYFVAAERCSSATDCHSTICASNTTHVHIECVSQHCTCSADLKPCLLVADCDHGRCIDRDGHSTSWHCLDGNCVCVRI